MQVSPENLAGLVHSKVIAAPGNARHIIAISGPPGSGKSRLAQDVTQLIGPAAIVVPMDGFHHSNDWLRDHALSDRKGAATTFDTDGLASLLAALHTRPTLSFPTFDRERDRVIADGGRVAPSHTQVFVEGNYLLVNQSPWADFRAAFDFTVFLQVNMDTLAERLYRRWIDLGLDAETARAKVSQNDLVNAAFVLANRSKPDLLASY